MRYILPITILLLTFGAIDIEISWSDGKIFNYKGWISKIFG